eukprot:TRINITY_DN1005_c1_g1_i1.p1 TRINITY_DN1005_c1_g1~~TRINITY_DN1005_c1_g1_i1.p1  ORF type:complete len:336 (+),score=100.14 TRINITY_DN1005_c1_g1_i1:51-1058(+)
MNINVKTPDATISVEAQPSWSCAQLKEAISKQIGVPTSSQKLTVGGKIMKDAKKLEDYPAAGTQAVSLVVTGGNASRGSSATESKGSSERQQIDGIVQEFIQIIKANKEAQAMYDKYKGDVPDTADLQAALGVDGLESVKTKVLDELTKVLGGDWTPFDQYHKPLRDYAMKLLGDGEISLEKRDSWVEKGATMGMEKFAEYPSVQETIAKESKDDRDLVKELIPVAKLIARRAMDLFIDGPNAKFSNAVTFGDQSRLLVVTAVGAMLDVIIDCLKDGKPQCNALMAKICGAVIEKLAERMPEYSTLFAFAGPMTMNQIVVWHDEYLKDIKGKSFP